MGIFRISAFSKRKYLITFSFSVLIGLAPLKIHAQPTQNSNVQCPLKVPQKITVIVRDFDTDTLLPDVQLLLFQGSDTIDIDSTNDLGYAEMRVSHKRHQPNTPVELAYQYPARGNRTGDTIKINAFLNHYELYTSPGKEHTYDPSNLIADVSLQTSLRIQNLFAKQLFINRYDAPENLNWYISYKRRTTLHKGNWYHIDPLTDSPLLQERKQMMRQVLCGLPARCKGDNNRLIDYTQATYPHLKMGNVALSFNPITPIEKAVVNSGLKRLANSMVTGLNIKWLKMINDTLTPWQNFINEYDLLMSMSDSYNHFKVRFYSSGMDLDTNLTTIVNCAEGGHILHGPLMVRKIDLITSSKKAASRKIILQYLDNLDAAFVVDFNNAFKYFGGEATLPNLDRPAAIIERMKEKVHKASEDVINPLSDSLLLKEVLDNVSLFKDTSRFKIWMINIAHHTYNHMFGHAVAFDQGGLFGGFLSKFMHNAHSSNEHYSTWRKMYYNISGPNHLGRRVMDALITRNKQGHRILIDLKHSGYATRKWFLDSVIVKHYEKTGELIPPVCSHCAANGQKEIEYSRYADEFQLRNAPIAKIFYPFELNLYDEEIRRIFENGGLIGIKLEQRGLGGFLNKHHIWKTGIKQSGELKKYGDTSLAKRYSYIRRWLRFYNKEEDSNLEPALSYIRDTMGADEHAFKILESDYISAEPFLQNLFYFIDHSGFNNPCWAWEQLCIGSDLDGVINPIDICPVASQYPEFKKRLKQFIPIFLQMRRDMYPLENHKRFNEYFSNDFNLDDALDQLFFLSAKNFTEKHFIDKI